MNKECEINYIEDRPGHDERYSTSNGKIMKETSWTVSTKLDDGLLKTIEYYYDNYN